MTSARRTPTTAPVKHRPVDDLDAATAALTKVRGQLQWAEHREKTGRPLAPALVRKLKEDFTRAAEHRAQLRERLNRKE